MRELENKVAVITGAASGIGFGLAQKAAAEGMKVVAADIEETALAAAAQQLRAMGAEVVAVRTDVAQLAEIEALKVRAYDAFGAVHLVCNNAGVSVGGALWEMTEEDWTWILGVNLMSVIHATRVFVPAMIAGGEDGHIVNTASMAGLLAGPFMGAYNATKHAVVAISETLFHELRVTGSKIGVSVLCPGWVNTKIADAERNRPGHLANTAETARQGGAEVEQMIRNFLATGMQPLEVAEEVFRAIRDRQFWILTHKEWGSLVTNRFEGAAAGRDPQSMIQA